MSVDEILSKFNKRISKYMSYAKFFKSSDSFYLANIKTPKKPAIVIDNLGNIIMFENMVSNYQLLEIISDFAKEVTDLYKWRITYEYKRIKFTRK